MAQTKMETLFVFLFMMLVAVSTPFFADEIGIEGSYGFDISDEYPWNGAWTDNGTAYNVTTNQDGQLVLDSSPGTGVFQSNVRSFDQNEADLETIRLDNLGYSAENLMETGTNQRHINITVYGYVNGTVDRQKTIDVSNGVDTVNLTDTFSSPPIFDSYSFNVTFSSDGSVSPALTQISVSGSGTARTGRTVIRGWTTLIEFLMWIFAILAAVKLAMM